MNSKRIVVGMSAAAITLAVVSSVCVSGYSEADRASQAYSDSASGNVENNS